MPSTCVISDKSCVKCIQIRVTFACVNIDIYIYMCVCIIYKYVHTYIYTHTHAQSICIRLHIDLSMVLMRHPTATHDLYNCELWCTTFGHDDDHCQQLLLPSGLG